MHLPEMLIAMRHELQDLGSALWSDAELTRSVQKSVSLMSRLLPKQSIIETTIGGDVTDESITMPSTADPDYIVDGYDLENKVDGQAATLANAVPDVPRRLTVTLTDADSSVTSLSLIVKGYDKDGRYVEETWYLKDLVSGTAKQGDLYFKRVIGVEIDNIAGNGASDTLDVGTGNAYDSYVYLANKPIKYDTENVTNTAGTTTYIRDTDYIMDYLNSGIKFINGGDMAAGTEYYVDYKRDPRLVDINSVVTKGSRLKVNRAEYPVGNDPPTLVTPEMFGDFMVVKSTSSNLTEDKHIRIHYQEPWAAPGEDSPGDYPEHLDNPVIVGSCGQALIMKAEKYVQQSVTEIALMNAAADSMATPLADINTALDKITTHVAEADTALDKVGTYLETNGTTDNAKEILADITDNIADLRTAIETALDYRNNYVNGESEPAAYQYLVTGDAYIITINDAERVAEKYNEYARSGLMIWQALVLEATTRLENLRSYIEEANAWIRIGDTFIAEGAQRLGMATAFVNEAMQRVNEVNAWAVQADRYNQTSRQYLEIAGRYLASGQAKINEMMVMLGVKAEFNFYKGSSEQFD